MIPIPPDPPVDATRTQTRICEKHVDEYVKKYQNYEQNKKYVYSLIMGQCTEVLRDRIESESTYHTISTNADPLSLLQIIKDLVFNFQGHK